MQTEPELQVLLTHSPHIIQLMSANLLMTTTPNKISTITNRISEWKKLDTQANCELPIHHPDLSHLTACMNTFLPFCPHLSQHQRKITSGCQNCFQCDNRGKRFHQLGVYHGIPVCYVKITKKSLTWPISTRFTAVALVQPKGILIYRFHHAAEINNGHHYTGGRPYIQSIACPIK